GDLRVAKTEGLQAPQTRQLFQTVVGDFCAGQVERLQLFQGRELRQSRIGDLRVTKLKGFELVHAGELLESRVGDGGAPKIELLELAMMGRQMFHAGIADSTGQIEAPQPAKAGQFLETRIGVLSPSGPSPEAG